MDADTATSQPAPDTVEPQLELWFDLFRDLALIEFALAGGIITLMGTVFIEAPRRGSAFVGVISAHSGLAAVANRRGQAP